MFYQYSRPENFYQRLHNKLSTVFVKTGQFLGVLWFEVFSNEQKLVFGSKKLKIWSIIASLVQISLITFMTYIITLRLKQNEHNSTVISNALVSLANLLYVVQIFVVYVIVIVRQKSIFKVVNQAAKLRKLLSEWKFDKSDHCSRVLLYNVVTKIVMDCIITMIVVIGSSIKVVMSPKLLNILYLLLEPVSLLGFSFVTHIFYIQFAFGLFLTRKLFDNLNSRNCCLVSSYYQDIYKFLSKVKFVMEAVMLILLFDVFLALVGEVRLI